MRSKSQIFQHAVHVIQAANIWSHVIKLPDGWTGFKLALQKEYLSRSQEDTQAIYQVCSTLTYMVKLREKYSEELVKEVCKRLEYRKVFQGNDVGRGACIILSGRVDFCDEGQAKTKTITHIKDNRILHISECFNEIGLNDALKGTGKALQDCELAVLEYKSFLDASQLLKDNRDLEKIQFLKGLAFLEPFSENELRYMSYHLEVVKAQRNMTLFKEGDGNCEWIYLVKSGDVSLTKGGVQLTKLIKGEIFAEEALLSYEQRQFTAKCVNDISIFFRITIDEFEKRVWYQESRKILKDIIAQKWIYRLQRYSSISEITLDKDDIQAHLQNLYTLLERDSIFDIAIEQFIIIYSYQPQRPRLPSPSISPQTIQVSASAVIKNVQQAKLILKNYKQNKITIENNQKVQIHTSLRDKYKPLKSKTQEQNYKKEKTNPIKIRTKFIKQSQSNVVEQLEQYIQLENVKDEQIEWGDDGTMEDKNKKIAEFYKTMAHYAHQVFYQNQNLKESQSLKSKQLDVEYEILQKKNLENIKSAFATQYKIKSDNLLRKEYFLRQLKKMQKRLKTLQLIKKGVLTLKYDQIVNEDGEIVDNIEPIQEDEIYEIVNGKKIPKFNFITSSHVRQVSKFKEVDVLITEQKVEILNTINNVNEIDRITNVSQQRITIGSPKACESRLSISSSKKLGLKLLRTSSANPYFSTEMTPQMRTQPMMVKRAFLFS